MKKTNRNGQEGEKNKDESNEKVKDKKESQIDEQNKEKLKPEIKTNMEIFLDKEEKKHSLDEIKERAREPGREPVGGGKESTYIDPEEKAEEVEYEELAKERAPEEGS